MAKTDLVETLLQLMGPDKQPQNFNELAGLVALVDLLGILNLLNSNISMPAQSGNVVQDALAAVLGQGGSGSLKSPGDLISLLGKNPALVASLMNLLMSSKESKPPEEKQVPEASEPEHNTIQQARTSRYR